MLTVQIKGIHETAPAKIFLNENLKSLINSHRIGQKTKPFKGVKQNLAW